MIIRTPTLKGNTWGTRRLYFVVRAFLFKDGPEYFYDYRIGHGYLLITDDTGTSLRSYSWHPYEWPRFPERKAAGLDRIRDYIESGFDGNKARKGRVWENDPEDLHASKDKSYRIPVSCDIDDIRRLEDYIARWVAANRTGYEIGPREHAPGTRNQISHSPQRKAPDEGATAYWMYGQNCFWWAGTMLTDIGVPLPASRISLFNLGIGITRRFFDNSRVLVSLSKYRFVRRIIAYNENGKNKLSAIAQGASEPQIMMPTDYSEDIKPNAKA